MIDTFRILSPRLQLSVKDTTVCSLASSEIQIRASSNVPGSFNWNTGATDSIITVNQTGLYIVHFKNACGLLEDSAKVIFKTDCNCQPFVPGAFTPNNDGINDHFQVRTICPVVEFTINIFNRYGQRVYYSNQIDEGWNGRFKGKRLPMGTYFYRLSYKTADGKEFQKKGSMLLVD